MNGIEHYAKAEEHLGIAKRTDKPALRDQHVQFAAVHFLGALVGAVASLQQPVVHHHHGDVHEH